MEIIGSLLFCLGLVASAQAVIKCNVQKITTAYNAHGVAGTPTKDHDPAEKTADCDNCFGYMTFTDKTDDYKVYTTSNIT